MKNMMNLIAMIALFALFMIVPAFAYPRVAVSGFIGDASVGNDFMLSLNLTNMDQECALFVNTNIQAGPPFIMDGVSNHYTDELCQNNTQTVDIPMRIDPTATGGTYQLTISNTYETAAFAEYSSSDTLNIFVKGTPDIQAYITDSSPIDVYAGDTATITVDIHNDGNFEAQGLSANLTSDPPLTVNWAKSYAIVGQLDAKSDSQVQFSIEVPKDAAAMDYPIHLKVVYHDEDNLLQEKNFVFAFHVKAKALFTTADAGSDRLLSNSNGKSIRLTLTNTGTEVAKNIKAKIQPEFPFSTDGSVRYIESLAPGQSMPVDFVVDVDKDGTTGTYGLDMILDFEDLQGKKLQDTATVSIKLGKRTLLQSVFLDYWFLWLLVIAVALLIVRGKKGKKK